MTREEALELNSWYSPDLKVSAFMGAEGRLCVIINGALQYLYPQGAELDKAKAPAA